MAQCHWPTPPPLARQTSSSPPRQVLENLHAAGLPLSAVQGFYTAEVRRGGERVGFDIVAVGAGAPARGPLARLGAAVPQVLAVPQRSCARTPRARALTHDAPRQGAQAVDAEAVRRARRDACRRPGR